MSLNWDTSYNQRRWLSIAVAVWLTSPSLHETAWETILGMEVRHTGPKRERIVWMTCDASDSSGDADVENCAASMAWSGKSNGKIGLQCVPVLGIPEPVFLAYVFLFLCVPK